MYYKFTALEAFVLCILLCFIASGFFYEAESVALTVAIAIPAMSIFFVLYFRDYKVIIDDEKITFFSIFKGKNSFYWSDISKFEIPKEINLGRFGRVQNLRVYIAERKFTFNIDTIDEKAFLKQLLNCCSYHNLLIIDLNATK